MAEPFVIRDAAVVCPRLHGERKPKKAHVSDVKKAKKKQEGVESFDCLIVEPFSPGADPMYLVNYAGSILIAAAIRAMQAHLQKYQPEAQGLRAQRSPEDFDRALRELQVRNKREQRIVSEVHSGVVKQAIERWLREELIVRLNLDSAVGSGCPDVGSRRPHMQLNSVETFGSLRLGCATPSSDVDLVAFIDTSLPAASLVRIACDCLTESKPPPWLGDRASVREVLQTSKCPVLTFDFVASPTVLASAGVREELDARGAPAGDIDVDHDFLTSALGFSVGPADSCDCFSAPVSVSVDLSFNVAASVMDTNFLLASFFPAVDSCLGDMETQPCSSEVARSAAEVQQLLLWLKHWTKTAGINEPKTGTLSSFGWRMLLLSVLVEFGELPCLRQGFASHGSPEQCLNGLNIWYDSKSIHYGTGRQHLPSILELVSRFVDELALCCTAASANPSLQRVFQMLTTDRNCDFDTLWSSMIVLGGQFSNPVIERAIENQLRNRQVATEGAVSPTAVKFLVVDVDGCLFDITPELLALDIEGRDTFFFNSKESIPETGIAPRVLGFLQAATTLGFQIVVISGRDESIIPMVRAKLEGAGPVSAAGATPEGSITVPAAAECSTFVRPFCYLFKDVGSYLPTVEHKANSVRSLLGVCARRDVLVESVGFIDDVEPHMAAFLEGVELAAADAAAVGENEARCRAIAAPCIFAVTACAGLEAQKRQIRLRPYVASMKDIVVLGLPSGTRKNAVLQGVREKLLADGEKVEIAQWDSGGSDQWEVFVQQVVAALSRNARFVLVKMVPDQDKLKKLALFLNGKSRILVVRAAEFSTAGSKDTGPVALATGVSSDTAAQEVMLACLARILHSNAYRLQRPGLGQHVNRLPMESADDTAKSSTATASPPESIWPPDEATTGKDEHIRWAENVWIDSAAELHGIVEVYAALLKRRHRITKLQRASGPVVLSEPICFYNFGRCLPWSEEERLVVARSAALLGSRKAAIKEKQEVRALMRLLEGGQVVELERDLDSIVNEVASTIARWSTDAFSGFAGVQTDCVLAPSMAEWVDSPESVTC